MWRLHGGSQPRPRAQRNWNFARAFRKARLSWLSIITRTLLRLITPHPSRKRSVLSIDRAGDYRSAVLYQAVANQMTPVREMYFPDSFGDLFNRVTELIGFEPRGDEHKVQWLSTLGQPAYLATFRNILHWNESAWPRFDRSYLDADELMTGRLQRSIL